MSQRHSQHRRTRRHSRNQAEGGTVPPQANTQSSWGRSRRFQSDELPPRTYLTRLIEEDAPLFNNSHLVLMYGPFQADMPSESGQGVATWLRGCLRQHGLPSLVRFDQRQRAQVFRRDQFQPWFDSLMDEEAS